MGTEKRITICGCGPGSPDFLTPAVLRAVEEAEVLAGSRRLLDLFPDHRAERIVVGAKIDAALGAIARNLGRKIVVLVSGDTGLASFAQTVIRRFGFSFCELIPGVSSVQVAFARLGVDWLGALILSAHRGLPKVEHFPMAAYEKIALLCGAREAASWAGAFARTLGSEFRFYFCENLTLDNESIREVSSPELTDLNITSLALILFIKKGLFS